MPFSCSSHTIYCHLSYLYTYVDKEISDGASSPNKDVSLWTKIFPNLMSHCDVLLVSPIFKYNNGLA